MNAKIGSSFGPEASLLAEQRLTAHEERDLVIAAECGDAVACRRLVEAFLPAITKLARGFQGS